MSGMLDNAAHKVRQAGKKGDLKVRHSLPHTPSVF